MTRQNRLLRTHAFSVFLYLYRFLFLLIIPLLRSFFFSLQGDLVQWFQGAWIDVLLVLLLFLISTLKWMFFKYNMDSNSFYLTYGILFRRKMQIPLRNISTLSASSSVWLRPLRITKIRVDTAARGTRKADFSFYVRWSEADRILELRNEPLQNQNGVSSEYRPGIWSIVLLSLFTSNTFPGIVMVSTFVSQAGKVLGEELSLLLRHTLEETARKIAFGLPPIAAAAALFLFIGWFAAFLVNLLQTKDLLTARTAHTLRVCGGALTRKRYSLRLSEISFVDLRQSLLTRLLRLYSVYLNAIGFGKEQADIAAIVPFSRKTRVLSRLSLLLPEFVPSDRTLRPGRVAFLKFLLWPVVYCALIPVSAAFAMRLFPLWSEVIRFVAFMAAMPAIWYFGVRALDFVSSGLSREKNFFTVRYSSGFYLHTVVVPWKKITVINFSQSIFQRRSNQCDISILTRAEGRTHHKLRAFYLEECLDLFGLGDDS